MKWHIDFAFDPLPHPAGYRDPMLLTGSCFAENMGSFLTKYKFDIVLNPHGILYNPASIANALDVCIKNKEYSGESLFFDHGLWHHWDFHERFSDPDKNVTLESINASVHRAHHQLTKAAWLIITLGTSDIFKLTTTGRVVGNCHKRSAAMFDFTMMSPEEIVALMDNTLKLLFDINKGVKVIFTVSPVRYIKYGFERNNLSKSILIYAVHRLASKYTNVCYFPAYEIVMDELRDYRFFAEDLVHPNTLATQHVWQRFTEYFLSPEAKEILHEITPVIQASEHRPLHPQSDEYGKFTENQLLKISGYKQKYPFLDFTNEWHHFSQAHM